MYTCTCKVMACELNRSSEWRRRINLESCNKRGGQKINTREENNHLEREGKVRGVGGKSLHRVKRSYRKSCEHNKGRLSKTQISKDIDNKQPKRNMHGRCRQ